MAISINDTMNTLQDMNPFTKSRAQTAADASAQGDLAAEQSAYGNLQTPDFSNVNYEGPSAVPDATADQYSAQTANASLAGPSAMNNISVNPGYAGAQQDQMAALQNLAANGGHNAASDANLAQIQQQQNQNARGQEQAILAGANARGQGGSGASLLAQLSNSQNATNNQSAQDLGVLGQEANTALAAGQGAASIGSNLQNTSFNEQAQQAAATDAIAKFNAQNSQGVNMYNAQAQNAANQFNAQQGTGVNLFNAQKNQGVNNADAAAYNQGQTMNNYQMPQTEYEDQSQRAGGMASADQNASKYYSNQADIAAKKEGGLFGGAAQLGSSAWNAMGGAAGIGSALSSAGSAIGGMFGGGGSTLMAGGAGDAIGEAAPLAAAWKGGRVPGVPNVPGDSPLNDFVNIKASPGEVQVPRTLAQGGSKSEIGSFVKNAPSIPLIGPGQNRDHEAMLSAIKNIRRRNA